MDERMQAAVTGYIDVNKVRKIAETLRAYSEAGSSHCREKEMRKKIRQLGRAMKNTRSQ